MKVLVIEDNKPVRDSLVVFLEAHKNEVLQASDGRMGLEVANEHFDLELIITDIEMPEMNGMEVLTHLRDTDHPAERWVLSGVIDSNIITQAQARGATLILNKMEIFDALRAHGMCVKSPVTA